MRMGIRMGMLTRMRRIVIIWLKIEWETGRGWERKWELDEKIRMI